VPRRITKRRILTRRGSLPSQVVGCTGD
jgi:hypothetical protein